MARHRGIVVVADALGTRALPDASDWDDILARRVQILGLAQQIDLRALGVIDGRTPSTPFYNLSMQPMTLGFSDAVAIVIETPDNFDHVFAAIAVKLRSWFVRAILKGELYRGAIAAGDYYIEGNIVVGPAPNAAGRCYDRANWGGLVIEPGSSIYVKSLDLPFDYPLWDVPTKGGNRLFHSLGWPAHHVEYGAEVSEVRMSLDAIFDRGRGDPGVEEKRRATLDFYDNISRSAEEIVKRQNEEVRRSLSNTARGLQ